MERGSTGTPRAAAASRWLACGLLGMLLGAWAGAVVTLPALSNPIPPQPLAAALAEFARQTRLQVVYVSTTVRSRMSKNVPAGIAPVDALALLLDGTGLSFEFLNPRTVRIFETAAVKSTAQASAAGETKTPIDHRAGPYSAALDDVLVTAFRRADPLSLAYDVQSLPLSVSVVGGERLEKQKLEQLTDYAAYVPGFNVAGEGSPGQASVILRGIAPEAEAASVGFYLDDAPMGSSGSHGSPWTFPLDLMPYDLERLEVLRGPQETHYGAGSEGGLVRYVLKAPNVNDFEARIGADLSTISGAGKPGASMRAVMNAPLVDGALAVRASAYDSYTPGYIDNAYSGARDVNTLRQYGGRVAALWQPAQSLSLKVGAFWHRIESDANAVESFAGLYTVPNTGAADVVGASASFGDLTENHAFESPFGKRIDYYSATLNWIPGPIELTSASAWSRSHTEQVRDDTWAVGTGYPVFSGGTIAAGLTRFDRNLSLEKLSEELRIVSGKGQHVEWMLGGFYTREVATDWQTDYAFDNAYQPIAAFAPAVTFTSLPSTFKERAVFGDLTWRVTDRLALTGGARLAHYDQVGLYTVGGAIQPPATTARQRSDASTPWMAAVRYYVAPEVSLYGRVATGYKPGWSNAGIAGVPPTLGAETLINYEAGLKAEFLDRKVRMDVSSFYIDWRNLQVDIYDPNFNTIDGGDAATKGVEFEAAYSPWPELKLTYDSAFTESSFTRTVSASPFLAGYQAWNVPKWSIALAADYDAPVTPVWRAHVGGVFRWVDKVWALPVASIALGGGPTFELPSYSVLDANAGITNGRLALKMFARNLTNKRAYLGGSEYLNVATLTFVQLDYFLLQPRTVGVGFDCTF